MTEMVTMELSNYKKMVIDEQQLQYHINNLVKENCDLKSQLAIEQGSKNEIIDNFAKQIQELQHALCVYNIKDFWFDTLNLENLTDRNSEYFAMLNPVALSALGVPTTMMIDVITEKYNEYQKEKEEQNGK